MYMSNRKALSLHRRLRGKIFVASKLKQLTVDDLSLIYTPGVASVCKEIMKNPENVYFLTSKGENVAVVTDGTRILGLGNIGAEAALPVMEGKSVVYRHYGQLSAYPICLATKNKKSIVESICAIAPSFGAINLEDIESPKVLYISEELEKRLSIPVFHDDRHGTAVVVIAALINSLKIVKKRIERIKVVIAGAGSAGYCIAQLLYHAGCKNIVVIDSKGAIYAGRKHHMNKFKKEIGLITNKNERGERLEDVVRKSDVIIGVSGKQNIFKVSMIRSMNKDPIVFALTNPYPEINPSVAKRGGARIVATGSYRYSNQVNNALVFPYLMKAILELKISKISIDLLYTTSCALAKCVPHSKLSEENIIPDIGDKKLQNNIISSLKKFIQSSKNAY